MRRVNVTYEELRGALEEALDAVQRRHTKRLLRPEDVLRHVPRPEEVRGDGVVVVRGGNPSASYAYPATTTEVVVAWRAFPARYGFMVSRVRAYAYPHGRGVYALKKVPPGMARRFLEELLGPESEA